VIALCPCHPPEEHTAQRDFRIIFPEVQAKSEGRMMFQFAHWKLFR
jgi:hypothetical protein